jgi:NDP-sugar pyrophosphorylase family protein
VKAVVLVGGLGTRLRPLTFSLPKPLLPVGERPLLQLLLEQLHASNVRDVILATGYHAELIHAFCGDGSRFGVRVQYVHEGEPLGTAGPLSLARPLLDGEDFLLINGDILTQFDFRAIYEFRRTRGYDLVVAYTRHVYESPFGVLSLTGDDVTGIVEKPRLEQKVSAGIYAGAATVTEIVPDGTPFTMPQLIETLLERNRRVGGFEIQDLWQGLETVVHFEEAVRQIAELEQRPESNR